MKRLSGYLAMIGLTCALCALLISCKGIENDRNAYFVVSKAKITENEEGNQAEKTEETKGTKAEAEKKAERFIIILVKNSWPGGDKYAGPFIEVEVPKEIIYNRVKAGEYYYPLDLKYKGIILPRELIFPETPAAEEQKAEEEARKEQEEKENKELEEKKNTVYYILITARERLINGTTHYFLFFHKGRYVETEYYAGIEGAVRKTDSRIYEAEVSLGTFIRFEDQIGNSYAEKKLDALQVLEKMRILPQNAEKPDKKGELK